MAVSVLNKKVDEIKIVYTSQQPSGTLNANSGVGATLTPTIPTGYKFLTHISVWNTGAPGIVASFDRNNEAGIMQNSVNVYQFNTNTIAQGRGQINLLTAFYK